MLRLAYRLYLRLWQIAVYSRQDLCDLYGLTFSVEHKKSSRVLRQCFVELHTGKCGCTCTIHNKPGFFFNLFSWISSAFSSALRL